MAVEEDVSASISKSQLNQTQANWEQEIKRRQSQMDALQEKIMEVKAYIKGIEADAKKDLSVLWRRVKTFATLLTYLKSKARIIAVLHLAHTSCGIKQLDGEGPVDKNGVPLSGGSRNVDISSFDNTDEETWTALSNQGGCLDEQDGGFAGQNLKKGGSCGRVGEQSAVNIAGNCQSVKILCLNLLQEDAGIDDHGIEVVQFLRVFVGQYLFTRSETTSA